MPKSPQQPYQTSQPPKLVKKQQRPKPEPIFGPEIPIVVPQPPSSGPQGGTNNQGSKNQD